MRKIKIATEVIYYDDPGAITIHKYRVLEKGEDPWAFNVAFNLVNGVGVTEVLPSSHADGIWWNGPAEITFDEGASLHVSVIAGAIAYWTPELKKAALQSTYKNENNGEDETETCRGNIQYIIEQKEKKEKETAA